MSDLKKKNKEALPELLCPVGSAAALKAAISGGADAVYMGGASFHARMYAQSFSGADLKEAISLAHAYGVKVYITLNTLVLDLELAAWLRAAVEAYEAGADALIVDDIGAVARLHRLLPDFSLHASTQMSVHSSLAGQTLKGAGFSRMVVARETSLQDLKTVCAASPLEIEMFVHGALCVCHSGQCLFSSLVGARSGNRGTCAQPCRLPYTVRGKKSYPLSLKDLTLAEHIPEILSSGVSSLKIEGRMKSPEYVYTTAKIWRTLLDGRRSATPDEVNEMKDAFSRGGFTDAYFTGEAHSGLAGRMLGTRSGADKTASRSLPPVPNDLPGIPLDLAFSMRAGEPIRLTLTAKTGAAVTAEGVIPEKALTQPVSEETVIRQLSRFGGTPYRAGSISIEMDPGLILPLSALNALRRDALSRLKADAASLRRVPPLPDRIPSPLSHPQSGRTASFCRPEQLTALSESAFSVRYLPVWRYQGETNGISLPAVIFDSEAEEIRRKLEEAVRLGARHVLLENPWQYPLIEGLGLIPHAGFRYNVTNRETLAFWQERGLEDVILSPELTLPQCRDLMPFARVITYGRIPLMVLEKCLGRELGDCAGCGTDSLRLVDRTGTAFPVLREWPHRSVVWNSQVVWTADWQDKLSGAGVRAEHFIFSTESASDVDAVLRAYAQHAPSGQPFRRIGVSNLRKPEPSRS